MEELNASYASDSSDHTNISIESEEVALSPPRKRHRKCNPRYTEGLQEVLKSSKLGESEFLLKSN